MTMKKMKYWKCLLMDFCTERPMKDLFTESKEEWRKLFHFINRLIFFNILQKLFLLSFFILLLNRGQIHA